MGVNPTKKKKKQEGNRKGQRYWLEEYASQMEKNRGDFYKGKEGSTEGLKIDIVGGLGSKQCYTNPLVMGEGGGEGIQPEDVFTLVWKSKGTKFLC